MKSGKKVKKGPIKLIPVEILDYLDDPMIPYCDQVLVEETNVQNLVNENAEENKNEKQVTKPRVGYEYRYRVSKMKEAKKKQQIDESLLQDSTTNYDDLYSPEKKQKVGWEYRYRIQRKNDAEKRNPSIKTKTKSIKTKLATEKTKISPDDSAEGLNKNTHKIGII